LQIVLYKGSPTADNPTYVVPLVTWVRDRLGEKGSVTVAESKDRSAPLE
jgi:hypothetical protein